MRATKKTKLPPSSSLPSSSLPSSLPSSSMYAKPSTADNYQTEDTERVLQSTRTLQSVNMAALLGLESGSELSDTLSSSIESAEEDIDHNHMQNETEPIYEQLDESYSNPYIDSSHNANTEMVNTKGSGLSAIQQLYASARKPSLTRDINLNESIQSTEDKDGENNKEDILTTPRCIRHYQLQKTPSKTPYGDRLSSSSTHSITLTPTLHRSKFYLKPTTSSHVMTAAEAIYGTGIEEEEEEDDDDEGEEIVEVEEEEINEIDEKEKDTAYSSTYHTREQQLTVLHSNETNLSQHSRQFISSPSISNEASSYINRPQEQRRLGLPRVAFAPLSDDYEMHDDYDDCMSDDIQACMKRETEELLFRKEADEWRDRILESTPQVLGKRTAVHYLN
ncbi:hypothetical protein BDF19DRAFT_227522 [Syncephalis fuscata]|nr:hypothetical protein BDF19DRAFT_227522 [Syncephalis fuscata]